MVSLLISLLLNAAAQTKDIGVGYAVGKLAQCLGIPYRHPIWEYAITNMVVDFKFGVLNRWNEWEDLSEIFRNAVEKGYRSSEGVTMPHPEMSEETRVVRPTRGEQTPTGGHLGHRDTGEIPPVDASRKEEISIREFMPDIWTYANTPNFESGPSREVAPKQEYIDDVNALQNLKFLEESYRSPPNQLGPDEHSISGKRSSRRDDIANESSGIGASRYAISLKEVQVHDGINGRYAVRPRMVDTLPIRLPRQLLPNENSSLRDLGRLDCHEGVQILQTVLPSDQQGNDQTKRGKMVYEYSWTGM